MHRHDGNDFLTENGLRQFFLFVSCVLLFGSLSVMLGQDVNWDLLGYHFYNGYAFIHHRIGHDIAPAMMQSYLNPFFDVINYILITTTKPKVTTFLLGAFSGATCFFLYKIAVILFANVSSDRRTIYALFSVIIGTTGAANISLLGTTTNDNKVSLLIIIALYCLIRAVIESEKKKIFYLILAGLIVGLAMGFKLTAACYAIGLMAGFLFSGDKWDRKHLYLCMVLGVFMVAGFVLANGYWMWFLYKNFQNPLFPYYNNIFHSSYAPYISFNVAPAHSKLLPLHQFVSVLSELHRFWQFVLLPFYLAASKNTLISEVALQDPRFAVIFFMIGVIGLRYYYQKKITKQIIQKKVGQTIESYSSWVAMSVFFFVSYFFWLLMFPVYRYALPLELTSGLLIVVIIKNIFQSERWEEWILTILCLILIGATGYPDWGRINFGETYFKISVPRISSDAVVIFISQPIAYAIPFFPAGVHFIGMRFIDMEEHNISGSHYIEGPHGKFLSTMINDLKNDKIKVPIYTLAFQFSDDVDVDKRATNILARFGMVQDNAHCQLFTTNVIDALKLCPVKWETVS